MDIGSIFLILALFILVGLFVARPFFENKSIAITEEEHQLSSLMAERDRIINALHELDFDYTLHKIPEEDYPAQRAALLAQGSAVLRQIDELQQTEETESVETRIEAAIAARRADLARGQQVQPAGNGNIQPTAEPVLAAIATRDPNDELEAMIAARRRTKEEKSSGFCPQCGGPVQKSDKFCSRCGTTL